MQYELGNISVEAYQDLIRLAFQVCDRFIFHKHSQLRYDMCVDEFISELSDSFLFSRTQNKWPGTISVPSAEVFYFRTTEEAKQIILGACSSIYEWRAPCLPDDLTFLCKDEPWLVCTAHEHHCYIETDEEEVIKWLRLLQNW